MVTQEELSIAAVEGELEVAQQTLDEHNARFPGVIPYRLMLLSRVHDTAHVALEGEWYTICGSRFYPRHEGPAQGAEKLCGRCRNIIVRRLS